MRIKPLAAALLAAGIGAAAIACGGSDTLDVTSGTVLLNATVVDPRDGTLTERQAIVIDGARITAVTGRNIRTAAGVRSVDAGGKFVVPGYLDMHTHALDAADQQPTYWPLLLAYGITGVREMAGSPATIVRGRQVNADIAAGKLDAPEILMQTGDLFVGQAATAQGGVDFVDQQLAAGADFIKVVGGAREVVLAILAEARRKGSSVAGHLVPGLSAAESSDAGWHVFEHLGSGVGLVLDCSTDEAAVRQAMLALKPVGAPPPAYVVNPRAFDGAATAGFYQRVQQTYSEDRCKALADRFIANNTWQVPTLIRIRTQSYGNDAAYRNEPNLIYVDQTRRALWQQVGAQFATMPASAAAALEHYYDLQLRVTNMMSQRGVKMLTGSDLSGVWLVPGYSLHQEFGELGKAGLSPLAVLRAATLNGAQFLGRESTMGAVAAGKNADLVLLDANPLAATANLSKIAGVVNKGKYLPRETLEKMKADIAAAYAAQPARAPHTALDPNHVD